MSWAEAGETLRSPWALRLSVISGCMSAQIDSKNGSLSKDLHGSETLTNAAESFEHFHLNEHQSDDP